MDNGDVFDFVCKDKYSIRDLWDTFFKELLTIKRTMKLKNPTYVVFCNMNTVNLSLSPNESGGYDLGGAILATIKNFESRGARE